MKIIENTKIKHSDFFARYDRFEKEDWYSDHRIAVIGCGDTGCLIVSRLSESGVLDVLTAFTIAVNATETGTPEKISADEKLFFNYPPPNNFHQAGQMDAGEDVTETACNHLKQVLMKNNAELCLFVVNIWEGNGAEIAPILAGTSRETGMIVMAIALCPPGALNAGYPFPGDERISSLRNASDSFLVVDWRNFIPEFQDCGPGDIDMEVLNVVEDAVVRIYDLVGSPSLICVDFRDVFSILRQRGDAVLLRGIGRGRDRAAEAVEDAMRHLIPALDPAGAKGCIVSIRSDTDLTLDEAETAAGLLVAICESGAEVIWGACVGGYPDDRFDVMALFTGLDPCKYEQGFKH